LQHYRDKLLTSYSVSAGEKYKDIIGALKGWYEDHQQAAAYRSQIKARIQMSGKILQESVAVIKQFVQ
jgi:hypothetical protein